MTGERRAIPGFPGFAVDTDGNIWSYWLRTSLGYGRGSVTILTSTAQKKNRRLGSDGKYALVYLRNADGEWKTFNLSPA